MYSNIIINGNLKVSLNNMSKSEWFEIFGSTYSLDMLYICLLTPLSITGLFLNLLCFYVLAKAEFSNILIFRYIKYHILISSVICVALSLLFLSHTIQIFSFTNTFGAKSIGAYIILPTVLICYTFSSILSIFITIERIYTLKARNQTNKPISTRFLTTIIVICVLLNIPLILTVYPAYNEVELNTGESFTIYYTGITAFAQSNNGKILCSVSYVFRDILTMTIDLYLNGILILMFKRHVKKRKSIMSTKIKELYKAPEPSRMEVDNEQAEMISNLSRSQYVSETCLHIEAANKADKNLTIMVILFSVLSVLEHLFVLLGLVSYVVSPDLNTFTFLLVCCLFLAARYASNVFIMAMFNSLFRKAFVDTIKSAFELY